MHALEQKRTVNVVDARLAMRVRMLIVLFVVIVAVIVRASLSFFFG
jgi:hypothetical protein